MKQLCSPDVSVPEVIMPDRIPEADAKFSIDFKPINNGEWLVGMRQKNYYYYYYYITLC